MKLETIHVVAGIIYNATRDQILIARRPDHVHQGGLWEFPGGKVESNESPQKALHRELKEELGIDIRPQATTRFMEVRHQYPEKAVFLDFWEVTEFHGIPSGREGQKIQWCSLPDLAGLTFPVANQKVIDFILLRMAEG